MANTPSNLFLQEITTTDLTTISNPGAGEVYSDLWLLINNPTSSPITIVVTHTGASDFNIVEKVLQANRSYVFTELVGLKINPGQELKVQGSASGYIVDLNASIFTT